MRSFVISDNSDTLMGMRLAGVEGIIVHDDAEIRRALRDAMHRNDLAVVFLTEKLAGLCADEVQSLKERIAAPLLVVIPDRHGSSDATAAISRYLAETVGIRI